MILRCAIVDASTMAQRNIIILSILLIKSDVSY